MAKPVLSKDVCRMLTKAGFVKDRGCASHSVWINGDITISVPDGHKIISPGVMRKVQRALDNAASLC